MAEAPVPARVRNPRPVPSPVPRPGVAAVRDPYADDWSSPTAVRSAAVTSHAQSELAALERRVNASRPHQTSRSNQTSHPNQAARPHQAERGLPAWAGLVALLVIAGIGGMIDVLSGTQVRGGFNYGIVIASIVAILLVRRSSMFPVVIAPPLVYAGASGGMLYVRSSGLHDKKVLFDAASNWLVYGFPAMASASAAVLIIAGIRLIVRR